MYFNYRFSIGIKCSECGKKLNAVEGLTYRDYDFVLEIEPHTCEKVEVNPACTCAPLEGDPIHAVLNPDCPVHNK